MVLVSSFAYDSSIYQIQQISCFACLSIAINYFVYFTLVPCALSLSVKYMTNFTNYSMSKENLVHSESNTEDSSYLNIFLCALHILKLIIVKYNVKKTIELSAQEEFDSWLLMDSSSLFVIFLVFVVSLECVWNTIGSIAETKTAESGETNLKVNVPAVRETVNKDIVSPNQAVKYSQENDEKTLKIN